MALHFVLLYNIIVLLAIFTGGGTAQDIGLSPTVFESDKLPADEDGNLLPRYMASVGNGHVATTVYTDTVYMNGLYNGERGESHRASIPSRNNFRLYGSYVVLSQSFGLDVGNGLFYERFETENFKVEQRTFAHRFYHKVIVTQIEVTLLQDPALANLTLQLQVNVGTSDDLNLDAEETWTSADGISASFQCGQTKVIEDPRYQAAESSVCVVATDIPSEIVVTESMTYTYFASYDTSLEGAANDFDKVAELVASGNHQEILNNHTEAWSQVWQDGRIEVEGNLHLAKLMYGCLYYLLTSLPVVQQTNSPVGQFYGLSPGGLAYGAYLSDYQGHSFWDTETWMYPPILYFYPDLAREILSYRLHSLPAARDLANETGSSGSRFPWESGFTGREVTPDCCPETRDFQIHITGDVGFAIRQYVSSTRDKNWLEKNPTEEVTNGCTMIRDIADFWASRASYDSNTNQFDINHVMPPDEDHPDVNNSIYTNVVAGYAIFFSEYAKCLCGEFMEDVPTDWVNRAKALTYLYDSDNNFHPEFEGYDPSMEIKQADVVLLGFPLLYSMNASTRKNDLILYEAVTRENGPAMTWAMHTVGFLELDDLDKASALFNKSYQPYMREPFKVWTEARAPDFGAVNFITGMGGFLQEIVSGYGGLRLYTEHIEFDRPRLLPDTTGLALRGVKYLGNKFDVEVAEDGTNIFKLVTASAEYPLELSYQENGVGYVFTFEAGSVLEVPAGLQITIKTTTSTNCPLPFDKIGGTYETERSIT